MTALVNALQPGSGRPRRSWVVGSLIVVGVASGVAWMSRAPDTGCADVGAAIEQRYSESQRKAIAEQFANVASPHGADVARRVITSLDQYSGRWRNERVVTCEATAVDHDQSLAVRDARVRCLRRRLQEFETAVQLFAEADATVVDNAMEVVGRLATLDRCRGDALLAEVAAPADDQTAGEVLEIRALLARAEHWRVAGHPSVAWADVTEAARRAEGTEYAPIMAASKLAAGRVREDQAQYPEAEQLLQDAYFGASEAGDRRVAMEASIVLIAVAGSRRDDLEQGRLWGRIAHAELVQQGAPPLDESEYLDHLAQVIHDDGDLLEAERLYREALRIRRESLDADHVLVAAASLNLASVLLDMGQRDEALRLATQGRATYEKMLDDAHPALTIVDNLLGRIYMNRGDDERAEHHHRRALDHRGSGPNREASGAAYVYGNLGILYRGRGDYDAALAAYQQALKLQQQRDSDTAATWINIANLHLDRGEHNKAHDAYNEALVNLLKVRPDTHPLVAVARLGMGENLAATGRNDEALDQLELARAALDGSGFDPLALARTRFILGRTLCSAGRDCGRGRKLAQQARDVLPEGDGQRDEIVRWLESQARADETLEP